MATRHSLPTGTILTNLTQEHRKSNSKILPEKKQHTKNPSKNGENLSRGFVQTAYRSFQILGNVVQVVLCAYTDSDILLLKSLIHIKQLVLKKKKVQTQRMQETQPTNASSLRLQATKTLKQKESCIIKIFTQQNNTGLQSPHPGF